MDSASEYWEASNVTQTNLQQPPPRILVLDPHRPSRLVFLHYVQQVGFTATGTGSLDEAKALLQQHIFHGIAVQCPLSDAAFVDVMRWLRPTSTQSKGLYILAITSVPQVYTRQMLLDCGADDYLVKPIPRDTAIHALLRMMAEVHTHHVK